MSAKRLLQLIEDIAKDIPIKPKEAIVRQMASTDKPSFKGYRRPFFSKEEPPPEFKGYRRPFSEEPQFEEPLPDPETIPEQSDEVLFDEEGNPILPSTTVRRSV